MTEPPPHLPRRLSDLVAALGVPSPGEDPWVHGLCTDSRRVRTGDAFLATNGDRHRGHDYVDDAVRGGAVAVLVDGLEGAGPSLPAGVPSVAVPHLRERLGAIAARFYGNPSGDLRVAGVTGTNGKTTSTHLMAQALGVSSAAGVVGTLGHGIYRDGMLHALENATHTTPDAVTLQRLLAAMREAGSRDVCMEVSSHALVQGRVKDVRIHTAVFTNLSRDHLDYHGDLESYAAGKRLLFTHPGIEQAVINVDDPVGRDLIARIAKDVNVISYSMGGESVGEVHAASLRLEPDGLRMEVRSPWGRAELRSALLGRFNAYNLLAAFSVLVGWGVRVEEAAARLGSARAADGRAEVFESVPGGPRVVLDYAHTPDALENVLSALREHGAGRLCCVFGCGGERDTGKRAMMGACAERLADEVIVTDDNPRGEDGDAIVQDILSGMRNPARARIERRRERAIAEAVSRALPGDVVLIAGKGHETYQEIAGRRVPFSDRSELVALGLRPVSARRSRVEPSAEAGNSLRRAG